MLSDQLLRAAEASGFWFEVERLWALLTLWATAGLDQLFDLSRGGGRRRILQVGVILLIAGGAGLAARIWLANSRMFALGDIAETSTLASVTLLDAIRIVLVLGIGSWIALRASGRFLSDIFALRDEDMGSRFISGLAWGSANEVLHLREGRIAEADQKSIMVLIGGPGRVILDSDTAALFEKADGKPHAVVPAGQSLHSTAESKSGTWIDGFERIREPIIDLRDQYIGSAGGESMTVVGRSLDGVPVSVVDVRGVFSVRRDPSAGKAEAGVRAPYPLRPQDIESLIYRQTVPVLTADAHASGIPDDWTRAMQTLIRSSLREFMSQNRLTDFIAGIGAQEAEAAEFREDTILARSLEVSGEAIGVGAATAAASPSIRPRTELSAKFRKYGSEFSTKAQQLGLELHWIGVGTWKIPEEASGAAVNEKHLEAWRMNRENAVRSDAQALERMTEEALLDGKLNLIQEVPISSHQRNQARYSDTGVLTECLLQDFWRQLGDALDILYRTGTRTPELERLEQAELSIEELLGIQMENDLLGSGLNSRVRPQSPSPAREEGPPAPASRSEATKYQQLLSKLEGSYKVAEAMIANEGKRHTDLDREQLIERIIQRFERHGR